MQEQIKKQQQDQEKQKYDKFNFKGNYGAKKTYSKRVFNS